MRAGQGRFDRVPIYFDPQPLPPEIWVDVTELMIPDVLPYYMISNYGRVYHKYRGDILSQNVDSSGYLYKPFATKIGPKNVRIHRLVLMAFNYIPGCENYRVILKDGNKTNCWLWNLEWDYPKDSLVNAKDTEVYDNRLTDVQIHQVCYMLEQPGNTLQYVAQQTGVSYSIVQAIQNKRSHTDISDQYNIRSRKVGTNFEIDQVHKLCQYFEKVPRVNKTLDEYCTDALVYIGSEVSHRLIKSCKKIIAKESYTYISKDYNF